MKFHYHAALTLLFPTLLICGCLAVSESTLADDRWQILERRATNNPEIVSVLRNLPDATIRSQFPFLLEIAWGYKSLPNGLPTDEELNYSRTLYASLDEIVGAHGLHVMTRTGDGGRTIYYYVSNAAFYRKAIREFFDAQPPMSVKVSVRDEAGWDTVRQMLDAIK